MYGSVVRIKTKAVARTPERDGKSASQVYVKTYDGIASGSSLATINKCALGTRTK
jgi:hypothetical protein